MKDLTIEEFVSNIQSGLTMSGALPALLPNEEIERVVLLEAMPWFYQNVHKALQKAYYYIPRDNFYEEQSTKYLHITMPDDVQQVIWVYPMSDRHLFQMGILAPNMTLNLDVTNQPMLTSFMTTVGELGVYKMVIDGFADVLNQATKNTYKYDFNPLSKRFEILTSLHNSVIAECYVNIQAEALFDDPDFYKYCLALSRIQLGEMLTLYDMPLPAGVKINGENMKSKGEADLDKIVTTLNALSKVSFFVMVRKG